jgi:hypothetical protein
MTATASASAAASAIYNQHAAAFANVSAYVVMHGDERVATIAFKYPRDGAGRLYAYVHWMGTPMVRGFAAGGGYDKHTAACAGAIIAMFPGAAGSARIMALPDTPFARFVRALEVDGGYAWDVMLRRAGFDVFQAV